MDIQTVISVGLSTLAIGFLVVVFRKYQKTERMLLKEFEAREYETATVDDDCRMTFDELLELLRGMPKVVTALEMLSLEQRQQILPADVAKSARCLEQSTIHTRGSYVYVTRKANENAARNELGL